MPEPHVGVQMGDEAARDGANLARLKIFLGMSAGVGKTYAMLKEARRLRERGTDLVIGWLEAHGRSETDVVAEGLEKIPPRVVTYRGIRIFEMDLAALVTRRPAIAIVDELAHSNTPGMRHPKRFEDILELLDAGISVFTTVNIQHLESMADSVELVTLAPVRERVPDSFFDRADEVQLVDLPPDELLERLKEGKVYTGPASREAVSNFFTRANLAVLREIALSHASRLASHEVLDIMRGDRGLSSAAASQRILVAVGPSPHGESLLRWARRLAYALRADLDCLSIETGEDLPERDKRSLLGNLDLARSLGASVTTLPNPDVAKGVVEFATSINASFIVMGKSGLSKARNPFRRPSLAERILKESGNVPVFAVQERPVREALRRRIAARLEISSPSQYLLSIGAIGVVTLANFLIAGYVGYWGASIPYLAMISLLALFVGRGPVLLAAFLSSALWDILFIPPRFTFVIANPADMLMLGLYFLVAMTAGWFTGKLKTSERMLKTRELRLQALSSLASNLAGATGRDSILGPSIASLRGFFDAEAIVLLKTEGGELASQPEGGWQPMDEKTTSAARYCLESGKPAGRDTDTLPLIDWHFVPMQTPRAAIGVIGLRLAEGRVWTGDLDGFFSTMSRTISIALERELLSEENVANTLSRESERLGKVLLDSVSHEMRTPLTIIQGSASALADEDTGSDSIARRILLEQISGGAARLDAIVENLLSMNRLESGSFALRLAESDPEELIAAAIAELDKDAGGHQVRVECRDGPFTLDCDGVLIVQVLVNLLRNAVRYAGDAGPITVRYAAADDGSAFFSVDDSGPGLPEVDLRRVFEKFYRSRNAVPGGCGLGLAICKGIVEAHGGTISASNLTRGGLSVRFTLPHRGLSGEGMTLP